MMDMLIGVIIGALALLPFRIAFETRTFVVWSSRRGWVMQWEWNGKKERE